MGTIIRGDRVESVDVKVADQDDEKSKKPKTGEEEEKVEEKQEK